MRSITYISLVSSPGTSRRRIQQRIDSWLEEVQPGKTESSDMPRSHGRPGYWGMPPKGWATNQAQARKFLRLRNVVFPVPLKRISILHDEEEGDCKKVAPYIYVKAPSAGQEQNFQGQTGNVLYVQQAYRDKVFKEFQKDVPLNPDGVTRTHSSYLGQGQGVTGTSLSVFTSLGQEIKYGANGDETPNTCLPPLIHKRALEQPARRAGSRSRNPPIISGENDSTLKPTESHLDDNRGSHPDIEENYDGSEIVDWLYTTCSKGLGRQKGLPVFFSTANDRNPSGGPTYLYVKTVATEEQMAEASYRLALIAACALHDRLLLRYLQKRQSWAPNEAVSFEVHDDLSIYAIVASLGVCQIYRMALYASSSGGADHVPQKPVLYCFERVADFCPGTKEDIEGLIQYVNDIHRYGVSKYGPSAFKDSENLMHCSPGSWLDEAIKFYYGSKPNTVTTAGAVSIAGG